MPALANSASTASLSPPSAVQQRADLAVIGERLQRVLGHGVHRERRGKGLDVEDVGRLGVLGSRAGPEETLRSGAGVGERHASAARSSKSRYAL